MENRAMDAARNAGYTDITLAQARIGQRIGPDGTRLTDLAEQAQVTKQTAGFLVDQLERAGYVERVPDPADGRARLIRLSARGAGVADVANAEVAHVEREWEDHLGAAAYRDLRAALLKLREITDPYR
ncbi:MarR family winged helix-turn-helix transcriptional regulator [Tsukamurella tyrosinosolvens]|uniref:MarR family winged helix-turn-helix transcriptional regulator n=1 Tax=Tsukamurella tyrosinosolvens TaxID=57704 RepID=UPI000DF68D92|nr:MarR family transcriptional regulator [Tsukamurella tyrosinosolvens]MEC4614654.1 MarR family transcriptional regulator [Tsukamurella tyrosinosolvens]RDB46039.1 MarR family transcriptional regulator [Tsukamurella tyrosinosolvens]